MQSAIQTDVVIIGAGPCGIFQVFELGLLGIKAHIVDALEAPGGQCMELYPDKPIYDIPAIPECSAQELIDRLMEQIEPFEAGFHMDQQVNELNKLEDGTFHLSTTAGTQFQTKAVIIAGGVGSFQPMPLRAEGAEKFVDSQIFYRIRDANLHKGKNLVVLGGGDSAFDWVLTLAEESKSLTMIHRTDKFRAAPATVEKMQALVEAGKMQFMIGNVTGIESSGEGEEAKLTTIQVTRPDKSTESLQLDQLLVFFGLSPRLGPIEKWNLDLEKNQIPTDTATFETNVGDIYAIGDIATYPGKKKLILSGFHEAALAAFAIKARLEPGKKVHVQYTTTSPIMHKRLHVETPKKR